MIPVLIDKLDDLEKRVAALERENQSIKLW